MLVLEDEIQFKRRKAAKRSRAAVGGFLETKEEAAHESGDTQTGGLPPARVISSPSRRLSRNALSGSSNGLGGSIACTATARERGGTKEKSPFSETTGKYICPAIAHVHSKRTAFLQHGRAVHTASQQYPPPLFVPLWCGSLPLKGCARCNPSGEPKGASLWQPSL